MPFSMNSSPESYVPTHTNFQVEFAPGEYNAGLRTLKAFKAGEIMAYLTEATTGHPRAYTSVQFGSGCEDNLELNSDLVYINHSCEPNVAFDVCSSSPSKWHVRALRAIDAGELLTFFYPSTEWDMAQPFQCKCEKPTCLGQIQGALYISRKDLVPRYWINNHIMQLVALRDAQRGNERSQL